MKGLWTVMRRLTLAGILALLAVGGGRMPSVALAATSNQIAYIYDDGQAGGPTGVNGNMSIFQLAMCSIGSTGTDCPGFTSGTGSSATYNTGNTTVTLTDVPVSTIDAQGSAALSGYDTLLLYEVCDIGSHATTMAAVNAFLAAGGKVLIFDADRCFSSTPGDPQQTPNYSSFTYPFTTSNPGPDAAGGAYRFIEQSTLTTGLTVGTGNQPGDSVGDANAFTTFNGAWCGSISGINNTGAPGFVQAYAEGPQGTGLVIYEGEDYWATGGGSPGDEPGHLRQVFNNLIDQPFNPDGLPCSVRASGISLTPKSGNEAVGGRHTDTATVVNASGAPISGISVTFTVQSGPDAGQTYTTTTTSTGQAQFQFSSTQAGTDIVVASYRLNNDPSSTRRYSNLGSVVWGSPTASRVAGLVVMRHEGTLEFRWRVVVAKDIVAFNVLAAGHRLNRAPIVLHTRSAYRYHSVWRRGPYVLELVLAGGQQVRLNVH